MRFDLDGLDVFFPYEFIYKEQYEYMRSLKQAIDKKGHALLEMPTGTGKTVCLLSLIISYKFQYPNTGKLVYCTRTVPEMVKCMDEVKKCMDYRKKVLGKEQAGDILAICLSARRNLCVHEGLLSDADTENLDSSCRGLTASWVRSRAGVSAQPKKTGQIDNSMGDGDEPVATSSSPAVDRPHHAGLCDFYETFEQHRMSQELNIPKGVYSLEDLKEYGRRNVVCPYFLTRYLINHADVIVYNYQYMLDPKVANLVSNEFEKNTIVVFDEAHNIDNVCIEALSVTLDTRTIDSSLRSIHRLQGKVADLKASDSARLQKEYRDLMVGLNAHGLVRNKVGDSRPEVSSSSSDMRAVEGNMADMRLASPLLTPDVLEEALPGSIRKAEHFIAFLKKIVVYMKSLLKGTQVENKTPLTFLAHLYNSTALERKPLRFVDGRLNSLLRTLEITSLEDFNALSDVANFMTLVATYLEGFAVILEPQGSIVKGVSEPLIQLACLDASIAIKPLFERFQSVIITSGTLSPMNLYPKLLDFQPIVSQSLQMTVFRPCLLPLIVTRGSDQTPISTRFESRNDESIARNFGLLLVDICATVPDGVCCFFPSYQYMEEAIQAWDRLGIIQQLLQHKLVFLETKDVVETALALDNFKKACDAGKGGLFLSISRGKVAEGVDFDRHYGRCVVVLGVPYQYTRSHTLLARLDFMREKHQIRGNDFLTFDALRQSSQCVGRVIRSKTDYGVVILADSRFNRQDKRSKFPPWILNFMKDSSLNLSTDVAIEQIKQFLRQMGQPIDQHALRQILLDTSQIDTLRYRSVVEVLASEPFQPDDTPMVDGSMAFDSEAGPGAEEGVILMKRRRIDAAG